ncbi:hypothetical protein [Komagataeibacter sp. FXV3]|uniref:hypothetical protein n=1 Tax=Komagataeibacter sp. FXV3 TaxID=2608998 RepID=UPI00187B63C5|nr:hypothetical protein [Komagataeibacter sp. FXV3]MBE7729842.1 hypothetical protein [Komagataeibacter sp. FXV3]
MNKNFTLFTDEQRKKLLDDLKDADNFSNIEIEINEEPEKNTYYIYIHDCIEFYAIDWNETRDSNSIDIYYNFKIKTDKSKEDIEKIIDADEVGIEERLENYLLKSFKDEISLYSERYEFNE